MGCNVSSKGKTSERGLNVFRDNRAADYRRGVEKRQVVQTFRVSFIFDETLENVLLLQCV